MKKCLKCGRYKCEDQFYRINDSRMKSGKRLHSYCKECKLSEDKKWRKTHQYEIKALRECRKEMK